jgi:hypothetical protein
MATPLNPFAPKATKLNLKPHAIEKEAIDHNLDLMWQASADARLAPKAN